MFLSLKISARLENFIFFILMILAYNKIVKSLESIQLFKRLSILLTFPAVTKIFNV